MNTMTAPMSLLRAGLLSAAITLAFLPLRAPAQEMDHSKMNMPAAKPAPAKKKPAVKKAVTPPAKPAAAAKPAPAIDHSQHQMPMPATPTRKPVAKPLPKPAMKKQSSAKKPSAKPASKTPGEMDHSAMGHDMPAPAKSGQAQPMDHSKMPGMGQPQSGADASMQGMDDSKMGHDMAAMPGMSMAPTEPITPIPVVTDADRAAAVRPAAGHSVHDNSIQNYTLIDRLEVFDADPGTGLEWEAQAWIGTDLDRLWLRSEGERSDGRTESADLELLYGHSVAAWWDVVAGIRHDFKPGASQDFAAFGVIGLAPYKFEIEATAYIGQSGQTAARFEAEYETLITNRLILQPLVEINLYGKDDPLRGIGSGLSTVEAGLRLRYEFTRRFAPYIGIVRERAFGGTADLRRVEGEGIDDTRFVAGLRIWF